MCAMKGPPGLDALARSLQHLINMDSGLAALGLLPLQGLILNSWAAMQINLKGFGSHLQGPTQANVARLRLLPKCARHRL